MARPALFLDRDGVINVNRADYVKAWGEFQFLPGVLDALRQLIQCDWPIVVVTNQSAIGRGIVPQATVNEIHRNMLDAVQAAGGKIQAVFYCPHRPADDCDCRKPRPGLLLQARERLQIDLARSVLVGDAIGDVAAALAVGCQPILVKTGRGSEQAKLLSRQMEQEIIVAENLTDAVTRILPMLQATPHGSARVPRPIL